MKNGLYTVSFQVNLKNHANEEEAHESIRGMLNEMLLDDQIPEVNFELVEEDELDYTLEEDDGVSELEFGESA